MLNKTLTEKKKNYEDPNNQVQTKIHTEVQ